MQDTKSSIVQQDEPERKKKSALGRETKIFVHYSCVFRPKDLYGNLDKHGALQL